MQKCGLAEGFHLARKTYLCGILSVYYATSTNFILISVSFLARFLFSCFVHIIVKGICVTSIRLMTKMCVESNMAEHNQNYMHLIHLVSDLVLRLQSWRPLLSEAWAWPGFLEQFIRISQLHTVIKKAI